MNSVWEYRHLKRIIFVLIGSLFLSGCLSWYKEQVEYCQTEYPILLVHGIGLRDDIMLFRGYWNRIEEKLRHAGARVFLSNQKAFEMHEDNAEHLKERVNDILKAGPWDKVNIIAHSKGGIEARYMISRLGMGDKVASLTTLNTPHRGSYVADYMLENAGHLERPIIYVANLYAYVMGDVHPDAFAAGFQLTREYMEDFNREVPNVPGVLYQSYSSVVNETYPNLPMRMVVEWLEERIGPNDGLVSEASAKWGVYKGPIEVYGIDHLSHFDIIGFNDLFGNQALNVERFYYDLVHDLKQRGY